MALLFHDEDDLTEVRPDILSYGVTDFENQMLEAESIVLRSVESRWYRNRADDAGLDWRVTAFDSSKLLTTSQLRRSCTYKSLELIYMYLMKESPDQDAFERQMETFRKLYKDEINEVLTTGLDYDWGGSGEIEAGENIQPRIRRLMRV